MNTNHTNNDDNDDEYKQLVQRTRQYVPEWAYLKDIALVCKQQRRLTDWSKLPSEELSDNEKQQLLDLPLLNEYLQ